MRKKTIIIWIIISTIFSLSMSLMSYFGIIRYIKLHVSPINKSIENFSTLPKATDDRVVISFHVKPENIDNLKPMIASLMDQTVKVDQIAMVLPLDSKVHIPKYISKIVNIFPTGKDYGKGNSIIPILLKENECDTIIIAVDTNVVYGKDFIEIMINEAIENPGTVLTDTKNTTLLVRPEYYDCGIYNSEKEQYDSDWFIKQANKAKQIKYSENYKRL